MVGTVEPSVKLDFVSFAVIHTARPIHLWTVWIIYTSNTINDDQGFQGTAVGGRLAVVVKMGSKRREVSYRFSGEAVPVRVDDI
jgi:hypothetical protein